MATAHATAQHKGSMQFAAKTACAMQDLPKPHHKSVHTEEKLSPDILLRHMHAKFALQFPKFFDV